MSLKYHIRIDEHESFYSIKDVRVSNLEIIITKRNFDDKNLKYFSVNQIHSDKIIIFDDFSTFANIEGDSIISFKNASIGVRTADCLPVFIYSENLSVIAVVHSGWRGTAKKILGKTVEKIKNRLNINLKELNFILGVGICENCYEIKEDMFNEFISEYGKDGEKFFNKSKFDLKQANLNILYNLGIEKTQIFNLNKCTGCNNDNFFSYRKEKTDRRTDNIITWSDSMSRIK